MRGVVVVLLAAAACRPKPPEPLAREPEIEPNEPDEPVGDLPMPLEIVLAPRPDIDITNLVPDPTHELRWPLSMASHPELEPQFEIAAALAEPGVGWTDLCRLGAHNRQVVRAHVAGRTTSRRPLLARALRQVGRASTVVGRAPPGREPLLARALVRAEAGDAVLRAVEGPSLERTDVTIAFGLHATLGLRCRCALRR